MATEERRRCSPVEGSCVLHGAGDQRLTERHEHPGGQSHRLRQPAEVDALLAMKQECLGEQGPVHASEKTAIQNKHSKRLYFKNLINSTLRFGRHIAGAVERPSLG